VDALRRYATAVALAAATCGAGWLLLRYGSNSLFCGFDRPESCPLWRDVLGLAGWFLMFPGTLVVLVTTPRRLKDRDGVPPDRTPPPSGT